MGRRLRRAHRVRLVERVRALLAWMLDPGDADQAARALLGGVPPTTDQVGRRLTRAFPELRHPAGPPSWATVGVQLADEVVYAQSTLNLD